MHYFRAPSSMPSRHVRSRPFPFRRHRRHALPDGLSRTSFLRASCAPCALVWIVSAVIAPGSVCAEPGAVGAEYPVEDRPIPPRGWWTTCTDARGIRTTLLADG